MKVTSIVAMCVSVMTLIITSIVSCYNLWISRRKIFVEEFAEYRVNWINSVRNLTIEFLVFAGDNDIEGMQTCKTKIDLYLNFKYDDHMNFSKRLESVIENNTKTERMALTIYAQKLIDDYWRKAKAEAGMSKSINRKIRKITYDNGKLYD